MKLFSFIVGTVFCFYTSINLASAHTTLNNSTSISPIDENSTEFNEQTIKLRLRKLNSAIDIRYTEEVRSYLISYIKNYRSQSELLLGRSTIYFPYFDQAMQKEKVSNEFKIVSVIESSLNPNAVSHAGAVGFFQFMPGTAKGLGLDFNSVVDERRDATKSAEAAAIYLKDLYNIFDDWTLALAAYNCGPRRIQNAIAAAGGVKDFWAIRQYLPRETRNYIPKFIAMNYVFTYYSQHILSPAFPDLDLQITEMVNSSGNIDLRQLSEKFEVPYEITKALNPAYRQGYIPASKSTMYVVLPARVMTEFKELIRSKANPGLLSEQISLSGIGSEDNASDYNEYNYKVKKGELLADVATRFKVSEYVLRFWNNMSNAAIKEGQILKIFMHNALARISKDDIQLEKLHTSFAPVQTMMEDANMINIKMENSSVQEEIEYIRHEVIAGETIQSIIDEYGEDARIYILNLNHLTMDSSLTPGASIIIGEKIPLIETAHLEHP